MSAPVLLVSTYELGHAPLGVAWPAAFLRDAGLACATLDLAVERFDDARVRDARLVAISVPMHTALRLGVEAAAHVRRANPQAFVVFHGHYAGLNAEMLLSGPADALIAGESEPLLVDLARAVLAGDDAESVPGVSTRRRRARPRLAHTRFPAPDRRGLPPLDRYAGYAVDGQTVASVAPILASDEA